MEGRCPTAASGKAFGAQGGHNGVGGATQSERTICGRKYLAELEFLVEDLEFWAELGRDLGRNFGQRLCAGQGEELPCGCHMPGCPPCPSREGGAEELCALWRVSGTQQVGPSLGMLPELALGGKFPGAWGNLDQEENHGITRQLKTEEQIKAWGEVSHKF